jgi:flagellar basal body-associated protein FliL
MAQKSKQRGRTLIIIALLIILILGLAYTVLTLLPSLIRGPQDPATVAVANTPVPIVEETVDMC